MDLRFKWIHFEFSVTQGSRYGSRIGLAHRSENQLPGAYIYIYIYRAHTLAHRQNQHWANIGHISAR